MSAIEAFRIAVPEADLLDLRERLHRTRWPEAETVADWSQGVPLAYLQDLCRHWGEADDWRACEARPARLDPGVRGGDRAADRAPASAGSTRSGPPDCT